LTISCTFCCGAMLDAMVTTTTGILAVLIVLDELIFRHAFLSPQKFPEFRAASCPNWALASVGWWLCPIKGTPLLSKVTG
jgi:hypothetical protein